MIPAYRSYAYLLTAATGAELEIIKSLFQDCYIKQVPEVSRYSEHAGETEYLYLIRIGNDGRFIQMSDQVNYDISISMPAGGSNINGSFDRGGTYNVSLRDYPNALFNAVKH